MSPKWVHINVNHDRELTPVRIVSDGAIGGSGVADGKLIPILIVDTSERPDIDELVRVHEHLPPGDVTSQWGEQRGTRDSLVLVLKFRRPTESVIILNFDLRSNGGTIDLILASRALYLQPGRHGDRLSTTLSNGKILVEIPETGFGERWKKIRYEFLVRELRGRGLAKQEAKRAANRLIDEFAKLIDVRLE